MSSQIPISVGAHLREYITYFILRQLPWDSVFFLGISDTRICWGVCDVARGMAPGGYGIDTSRKWIFAEHPTGKINFPGMRL